MIVDASALIAILRDEPDAATYAHAIELAADRRVSAVNYVETAVVIDGSREPVASRRFDQLVAEANLAIEPVTMNKRGSRARPIAISVAAAVIRRGSISVTVSPTRLPRSRANRCSTKARILPTPM
jgi:uncharacterized protein with PIN domain